MWFYLPPAEPPVSKCIFHQEWHKLPIWICNIESIRHWLLRKIERHLTHRPISLMVAYHLFCCIHSLQIEMDIRSCIPFAGKILRHSLSHQSWPLCKGRISQISTITINTCVKQWNSFIQSIELSNSFQLWSKYIDRICCFVQLCVIKFN